ncbi:hypothetical protein [Nonomuraea salmonea]|uniref:Uncharacterized protein n=1 Tax=Nonomuraea salmonea TaxID=46181 RepID=A0ABV5P2V2_9ACTN
MARMLQASRITGTRRYRQERYADGRQLTRRITRRSEKHQWQAEAQRELAEEAAELQAGIA